MISRQGKLFSNYDWYVNVTKVLNKRWRVYFEPKNLNFFVSQQIPINAGNMNVTPFNCLDLCGWPLVFIVSQ